MQFRQRASDMIVSQACHLRRRTARALSCRRYSRAQPGPAIQAPHAEEHARSISAFTRVFDALCVRESRNVAHGWWPPHPSRRLHAKGVQALRVRADERVHREQQFALLPHSQCQTARETNGETCSPPLIASASHYLRLLSLLFHSRLPLSSASLLAIRFFHLPPPMRGDGAPEAPRCLRGTRPGAP
jgi:hypothetical protein